MSATATALFQDGDDLFVCCPYCEKVHRCKASETPRLIEVEAVCDSSRKYAISPTMKPRSLAAALNLYHYEARRKQDQYRRRKDKSAAAGAGEAGAASE